MQLALIARLVDGLVLVETSSYTPGNALSQEERYPLLSSASFLLNC